MNQAMTDQGMTGQAIIGDRIDKWLFHARFYRTRPLAQAAAGKGKLRLNGNRVEKPAQTVRPGDILTLPHGRDILAVRILALAERRGPASQARQLYEIVAD
jgi:ribosome-associated heat shock protein Hsp15